MKALILVGPGFEDIEVLYPYYRLLEEGLEVDIAAPQKGPVKGKIGYTVEANKSIEEIDPAGYDVLVLPGGRGPERIRIYAREKAVEIVRHFMDEGKPVAAICHGPQLLVSADRVRGRVLTSYPGIADDIVMAGGKWVDKPVVVDGNLVTARIPSDIPYWFREFIKLVKK